MYTFLKTGNKLGKFKTKEVFNIDVLKKISKITSILIFSFLIITFLFSLTLMIKSKTNPNQIQSIFGFKPLIVLSGSMKPELNPGDLIFSRNVSINNIKKGDIITFIQNDNTLVTHRVSKISYNNGQPSLTTKGDSNNDTDSNSITEENLIGKYSFKIPRVGYLIEFAKSSKGFNVFILFPGLIIILIELKGIFSQVLKKNSYQNLRR